MSARGHVLIERDDHTCVAVTPDLVDAIIAIKQPDVPGIGSLALATFMTITSCANGARLSDLAAWSFEDADQIQIAVESLVAHGHLTQERTDGPVVYRAQGSEVAR